MTLARGTLLLLNLATAAGAATVETPLPRVCATYSSWPTGSYQFREIQVPCFAQLGWPYDRHENVDLARLATELERCDIFAPPSLYNYDHAQPFEQYRSQWQAFLQRGGIVLACDANYGQMQGWVSQLGDGLELQSAQCPAGMKGEGHVAPIHPEDPAAPPAACKCPWAHFGSVGRGWTVVATCPDGHPVCVRASIGRGVLIATNLYDDAGFPTPAYLDRLWQAQWPRLMAMPVTVGLDRGPAGVGRKTAHVTFAAGQMDQVVCEQRHGDGAWQTQTTAVPAAETTLSLPLTTASGRNDVRLVLLAGGQRRWWTSWCESPSDVVGLAAESQAGLQAATALLQPLPAEHPLRRAAQTQAGQLAELAAEAAALAAGPASAATAQRWQALDQRLAAWQPELKVLAGRGAVAARVARELPGRQQAFAVVRSHPLTKVFRDAAPAGPLQGGLELEAARGEGESTQIVVVPLADDLGGVRVALEPFVGADGRPLLVDSEVHRVGYVHTSAPSGGAEPGPRWWPDPLLPAESPFAVAQVCQPIWLDVWAPRTAPPGRYTSALVVTAGGQSERVPLVLRVLDFALPVEHSLRQVFAFRAPQITQRYQGQADYKRATSVDTFLRMMDVCLKRRVGVQPFGWEGDPQPVSGVAYLGETRTANGWQFDFTQADRIWQHQYDAGLRTLLVGITPGGATGQEAYWTFLEAYLRALVPHLQAKGWLDAAVCYMVDEAWQEEAIQANLRLAALLDRLAPGLKRLLTAPRDPRLYGRAQIWVPGGLPDADPHGAASQALLQGWLPTQPERWWYICCGPLHPYPNFFVDYPTLDPRVVFWLTWRYHQTGFLYWGVEYYGDPQAMTPDGPTVDYPLGPANQGNGDGTLCYWGPHEEFLPSIRLDTVRDGIEDYECFALARQLCDAVERAGTAAALVARVRALLAVDPRVIHAADGSPDFVYTLDPEVLVAARHALNEAVLALRAQLRP